MKLVYSLPWTPCVNGTELSLNKRQSTIGYSVLSDINTEQSAVRFGER